MLSAYEQLRLSGAVPQSVRSKLSQGEWHMTQPGEYHSVHYDEQRIAVPGQSTVTLDASMSAQPLKFRLRVEPNLTAVGDRSNIDLLRSDSPIEVQPPNPKDPMPGALANR